MDLLDALVEREDPFLDVPQDRFLSWSDASQYRYCWKRDLDSVDQCEDHERTFYVERAEVYRKLFEGCA